MALQDQLMSQLTDLVQFGNKIRNANNITQTGLYALDASEKNPNITGTLAQTISQLNSDLAVERGRISRLTALPAGSTTGDAELMDIRYGANGKSYATAGDAVRDQVKNYRDIVVSANKPTADNVVAWVDIAPLANADAFYVPEVRDDTTNSVDTWSSSKINNMIKYATKDVIVSETQPSASDTKLWIDQRPASEADSFMVPEIRDDSINSVDTWSSSKINSMLEVAHKDVAVQKTRPAGTDTKIWIDTSEQGDDQFIIPEVRDDLVNSVDTWSSAKIKAFITQLNKDIVVSENSADAHDAKLWIDPDGGDYFMLPQIDDQTVSQVDTWSSQKINLELQKIIDTLTAHEIDLIP
ncbi:MAG: hypothetical protein NC548_37300 [Lachnospiraceae bacterium]|nr:hypothetical protein [Lachnospiraceae bacterium]